MTNQQKLVADAYLKEMEEILSFAKLSDNTKQSYHTYTIPFMEYCFDILKKDPKDACEKDVRDFLMLIQEQRNLKDRTVNLAISTIHFLFNAVLNIPWNSYKVPFRKFDEFIPFVPSVQEVQSFISSIKDPELKTIITILYSTGLRVSEACSLLCGDISKTHMRIHVSPTKNRKERFVEMPDKCYDQIVSYFYSFPSDVRRSFSTQSWLFPQRRSLSLPIYENFIHGNIPKIEKLLGWPHRLTSHSFRRAFATHNYMMKNLTLEEIQLALDHSSINTTRIYIRGGLISLREHHPNAIDGMSF